MHHILLVNGPNLNLLGEREPERYGTTTLADLETKVREWGTKMGLTVTPFQSNHEGAIIDRIHEARTEVDGIVINPGALSHTSRALYDALVAVALPVVEIHISNIMTREEWRRQSVTAAACLTTIYGRGVSGYRDALRALVNLTAAPPHTVAYGAGEDEVVDVRLPGGSGPHPTALFLHGGFWRGEWARDTIDGLAVDLHRRGWTTANAEYRRLDRGGGWPVTAVDVLAALETLLARDDVDPDRFVLIGHSAGGQLALTAAGAASTPPTLVVALAPMTDLRAAYEQGLNDGIVEAFMNGTPQTRPAAYDAASPIAGLTNSFPRLLVHGSDDALVPVSHSRRYVEVAAGAGVGADLIELAATGHFELLDPAHGGWQEVCERLPG